MASSSLHNRKPTESTINEKLEAEILKKRLSSCINESTNTTPTSFQTSKQCLRETNCEPLPLIAESKRKRLMPHSVPPKHAITSVLHLVKPPPPPRPPPPKCNSYSTKASDTSESMPHHVVQGNQKQTESGQSNKTSSIPGKLRPEAFAFLDKADDTTSNLTKKKHFVKAALMIATNLDRSDISVDSEARTTPVDHSPTETITDDNTLNPSTFPLPRIHINDVPESHNSVAAIQNKISDASEDDRPPPLPARPPPVFKYPPGFFLKHEQIPVNFDKPKAIPGNVSLNSMNPAAAASNVSIHPHQIGIIGRNEASSLMQQKESSATCGDVEVAAKMDEKRPSSASIRSESSFDELTKEHTHTVETHMLSDSQCSKASENAADSSGYDEEILQFMIDRPTLPRRLKTTQRSLSCSSLVQTFKDMGLSRWNVTEKDKASASRLSVPSANMNNHIKRRAKPTANIKAASSMNLTKEPKPFIRKTSKPTFVKNSISSNPWYHEINSTETQRRLLHMKQDGAFLIRPSSMATEGIPYTMCVTQGGRILNCHIRRANDGSYALGKFKPEEKTFSSLSELIRYHQDVPLEVRPSGLNKAFAVCLLVTPPKMSPKN